MRLYVFVIAWLVGVAMGTAGGWKARDWKAGADDKARMEAEAESARLRARQVDSAAQALEVNKAAAEVRWRTVTKEVERVVEKPVYRSACFDDDGLRLIANETAARAASQPAPAVPSAAASGAH